MHSGFQHSEVPPPPLQTSCATLSQANAGIPPAPAPGPPPSMNHVLMQNRSHQFSSTSDIQLLSPAMGWVQSQCGFYGQVRVCYPNSPIPSRAAWAPGFWLSTGPHCLRLVTTIRHRQKREIFAHAPEKRGLPHLPCFSQAVSRGWTAVFKMFVGPEASGTQIQVARPSIAHSLNC